MKHVANSDVTKVYKSHMCRSPISEELISLVTAGLSSLSLRTSAPCFSCATILPFGKECGADNHDLADLTAGLHPVRHIFNAGLVML